MLVSFSSFRQGFLVTLNDQVGAARYCVSMVHKWQAETKHAACAADDAAPWSAALTIELSKVRDGRAWTPKGFFVPAFEEGNFRNLTVAQAAFLTAIFAHHGIGLRKDQENAHTWCDKAAAGAL